MRSSWRIPLLIGVVFAVGCAPPAEPVPSPAEDRSGVDDGPTAAPDAAEPMVADWSGGSSLPLPNGWVVAHCQGEAPMLCVSDGDRHVGVIELVVYPADDVDDDDLIGLREHIDTFVADLRRDRTATCPHLTLVADTVIEASVGGLPGLRGDFRLVDAQGVTKERHILYWTVRAGERVVVNAAAYDDGGCLERTGEFVAADLEVVAEHLDRIVADTPVPPSALSDAPLADGTHVARIVGVDPPVAAVVIDPVEFLSGSEALAAARASGDIGPDEDLPNGFYVRDLDAVTHHVGVDDDTKVTVFDCTATCTPVEVDLGDFLAGRVGAMNGGYALFTVVIDGGRITELAEIYLP